MVLLVMVVWELVVGLTGAAGETVLEVSVEVREEEDEDDVVDTEVGTVGAVDTVEDEVKVVDCLVTVYVDTNAPEFLISSMKSKCKRRRATNIHQSHKYNPEYSNHLPDYSNNSYIPTHTN